MKCLGGTQGVGIGEHGMIIVAFLKSLWLESRQKRLGSQLTLVTLGESRTKTMVAGKSLKVKAFKDSKWN